MTPHALAETAQFQGLFQFTFEEAVAKLKGEAIDVRFERGAEFSFIEPSNAHSARFAGTVELGIGTRGETAGTLFLHLPVGLEGEDVSAILDDATMEVSIESMPGALGTIKRDHRDV